MILRSGIFRSDVTWASLNRDGTTLLVTDRLTGFVLIAAKTSLHSFRRMVEFSSLGDVFAQQFKKIMENSRDGKICILYPMATSKCCMLLLLVCYQ